VNNGEPHPSTDGRLHEVTDRLTSRVCRQRDDHNARDVRTSLRYEARLCSVAESYCIV
jgi:hypothetical protein